MKILYFYIPNITEIPDVIQEFESYSLDEYQLIHVDIIKDKDFVKKHDVKVTPSFILLDSDENEVSRLILPTTIESIADWLFEND